MIFEIFVNFDDTWLSSSNANRIYEFNRFLIINQNGRV